MSIHAPEIEIDTTLYDTYIKHYKNAGKSKYDAQVDTLTALADDFGIYIQGGVNDGFAANC